jgi:mono/diheme cytochrome c family protein
MIRKYGFALVSIVVVALAIATIAYYFNSQSIQPPPDELDGASLYATYCSSCHEPLASSEKKGASVARIQAGIENVGAMRSLSDLTAEEIEAIAKALSQP